MKTLIILTLAALLSGCSCRMECGPDLSTALRAIQIIAEK